jgi:acyl-CoA hydrolase
MDKQTKRWYDSRVITVHKVMSPDANFRDTLFGGTLAGWMDVACGITAERHSGLSMATAIMDITLIAPVRVGDVLEIDAYPSYVGGRSLEISVVATIIETEKRTIAAKGHFVFVAIDSLEIPFGLEPTCSEDEKMIEEGHKRYLLRKAQRAN